MTSRQARAKRAAVWGLPAPVVALGLIGLAARSGGGSSWPEPMIDLAAFALTMALTLAPLVGIVAALMLIAGRR